MITKEDIRVGNRLRYHSNFPQGDGNGIEVVCVDNVDQALVYFIPEGSNKLFVCGMKWEITELDKYTLIK